MALKVWTRSEWIPSPMLAFAGALAVLAGLIHLAVAPEHFGEGVEFGLFMLVVGGAQVAAGVLLATRPSRLLITSVIVGSLVVGAIYGLSRTVGLPFGPHPWRPEALGPMDLASKVTELALVAVLAFRLMFPARSADAR